MSGRAPLDWILGNFWRLALGAIGFGLGLCLAIFGIKRTLLILALGLLGFLIGKWLDEGRPGGGIFRGWGPDED